MKVQGETGVGPSFVVRCLTKGRMHAPLQGQRTITQTKGRACGGEPDSRLELFTEVMLTIGFPTL